MIIALLALSPVQGIDVIRLLEDVEGASAVRYGARDDKGNSLDCLKIAQDGKGYLGIYHTMRDGKFRLNLARSENILEWTYLKELDEHGSQGTLARAGQGWLVAYEKDSTEGNWIRFRYYSSSTHLARGEHANQFDAPRSLSKAAEGTPNFRLINWKGSPGRSKIVIGFHYWRDRDVDRQAQGTLDNFNVWNATKQPEMDQYLEVLGFKGNIGDRDRFLHGGTAYEIIEAQERKGDWKSWRVFLRGAGKGAVAPLNIRTKGGSVSFANPTVSTLTLPSGRRGVVITLFLPSEGAAKGEPGCLIYVKNLTT